MSSGWQAMQLMTVGSKWELVLPPEHAPELGYGNSGKQGIPAQSVMVFTLEILSCEGVPLGDPVHLTRIQVRQIYNIRPPPPNTAY